MTLADVAQIAHEANRTYCALAKTENHLAWDDCPQEHRDRMILGVKWNLLNPDVTPEDQHENWCKMMVEDGWTFGENGRDEANKTHWCLRPYHELPVGQQIKDNLFRAIVKTFTPFIGELPA